MLEMQFARKNIRTLKWQAFGEGVGKVAPLGDFNIFDLLSQFVRSLTYKDGVISPSSLILYIENKNPAFQTFRSIKVAFLDYIPVRKASRHILSEDSFDKTGIDFVLYIKIM